MHLILDQLVYTSFPKIGFRLLVSERVPTEIEQAFIQLVVSQHWNSYTPLRSGYRSVYLHQVSPKHTLFGWLYNDGADDMGRSQVPYFICYYLAELLQEILLKNIFICLDKGPVALIDRHSLPSSLETIVDSTPWSFNDDFWSYHPARPGVTIPLNVYHRSQTALQDGKLLDLFLSVDGQDTVVALNAQTLKQEKVDLSIEINQLAKMSAVNVNRADAAIVNGGIKFLPHYENALVEAIRQEYPINDKTRHELQEMQRLLNLTDEDIEPIKARINEQLQLIELPTELVGAGKGKNPKIVKTFNNSLEINQANNSLHLGSFLSKIILIMRNFHKGSNKRDRTNFDSAYKNSQLLFRVSIAAIILALAASIFGLVHNTIFSTIPPEFISQEINPVFYKNLSEVPNVPQGLFHYGGATTFAPMRSQAVTSALSQAHPQFKLNYIEPIGGQPGSDTGIKMLLADEISFAQSSRPINDTDLGEAKKRGFTIEQVPVAIDGIAFYVNPQVSIKGLTLSQINSIFTGKIRNWKALGGPNIEITPITRNFQNSSPFDVLKEKVLAGENLSTNVQQVENTTQSIRQVAQTPGGIGYATASGIIGQKSIVAVPLAREANQDFVSPFSDASETVVNRTAFANASYPLTRRLFIIIKRNSQLDEQAGSAYANLLLTDEGQRLIEETGFVRIR